MAELLAIVSLKECPKCKQRAPLGEEMPHHPSCLGDEILRMTRGLWPIEPGTEVVWVEPTILE